MRAEIFPDESAGEFPEPPATFTDGEGRDISVRVADADVLEELVEMYVEFDPEDRAQGIPPVREDGIREWLDTLLDSDCLNVVARHGDSAVGHATLVPDRGEAYELAIFVLHTHQGAGIGTVLLKQLLGHAQASGIELVWLTVERWNKPAITLYKKVGFETASTEGFELEMGIRL